MNERDYRAIKKGMKEHITATVMGSDGSRKSWAKLSTGKWVAVKDSGDLDDFEILPDDLSLCSASSAIQAGKSSSMTTAHTRRLYVLD